MNESYVLTVLKFGLYMLTNGATKAPNVVKSPRCRMLPSQRQFHLYRGMISSFPLVSVSFICLTVLFVSRSRAGAESPYGSRKRYLHPSLLEFLHGRKAFPTPTAEHDMSADIGMLLRFAVFVACLSHSDEL
jgi:hypothetical protein